MIQTTKGKYFRARQKARVRQPSWGLFGFWSRRTCRGLECTDMTGREESMGNQPCSLWDSAWPASPTTSAKSATSPGLPGGGLATYLHSSLCVPMISSQPCSRPWDRRLCLTLQMRGHRNWCPVLMVILPGLRQGTLVSPRLNGASEIWP